MGNENRGRKTDDLPSGAYMAMFTRKSLVPMTIACPIVIT